MKAILQTFISPFIGFQTFRNLACLLGNIVFGFAYYFILQIGLALAWGLTYLPFSILPSLDWASQLKTAPVILAGLLVLPILVWILQLFVLPEQWLANFLMKADIPLDEALRTKDSNLLQPIRLFAAASTWKRLLHALLKIPLGVVSFAALFLVLLPVLALLATPLAYLAGFQDLIVGAWRMDTFGNASLASLSSFLLLPLTLHGVNLLAKFSGCLAKVLLTDSKG